MMPTQTLMLWFLKLPHLQEDFITTTGFLLEKDTNFCDKCRQIFFLYNMDKLLNSDMDQIQKFQSAITKLIEWVEAMSVNSGQHVLSYHRQHFSQNRHSSQHNSKNHTYNTRKCWYQYKFGSDTKKCTKLCIFIPPNQRNTYSDQWW